MWKDIRFGERIYTPDLKLDTKMTLHTPPPTYRNLISAISQLSQTILLPNFKGRFLGFTTTKRLSTTTTLASTTSQLWVIQFWPNFKLRFLGSTKTKSQLLLSQLWPCLWDQQQWLEGFATIEINLVVSILCRCWVSWLLPRSLAG